MDRFIWVSTSEVAAVQEMLRALQADAAGWRGYATDLVRRVDAISKRGDALTAAAVHLVAFEHDEKVPAEVRKLITDLRANMRLA